MAGHMQEYVMPTIVSHHAKKVDPQQSLYEKYKFESVGVLNDKEAKRKQELEQKKVLNADERDELEDLIEKDKPGYDVGATPKGNKTKPPTKRTLFDESQDDERQNNMKQQKPAVPLPVVVPLPAIVPLQLSPIAKLSQDVNRLRPQVCNTCINL